jgi:predicted Zn-dependent protease
MAMMSWAARHFAGKPVPRGIALSMCLVAMLPLARAQAVPASHQPVLSPDELRHLIDRGHAAEALAQLNREAASLPMPAGVERLRGMALYTQGKLPEAEQAFAAALQQNPADLESMQMRGITLFRLGRPAAAIPLLEAARSNVPPKHANSSGDDQNTAQTPVDPAYVLALCYLDTRRYDEARGAFARQFGFQPDSAAAYLLAARMLLRREYLPVAQQFARKALELTPGMPRAHLLLGETELAGDHMDEAIKEFTAERTLNPLEPATYDRLGDAYVRQGDLTQARLSLQEAILLEPNSTGPFILLGKVLLKQGDAAGAATYLEHARSMDAGNYMTHSLLGQAYRQMGRADDARRETDSAQKLQAADEPKLGAQQ